MVLGIFREIHLGRFTDTVVQKSVPMQRGARFAFSRSAPMQRGARFAFCEMRAMQRGARFFLPPERSHAARRSFRNS